MAVDIPLTVYKSEKKGSDHTKKEMNDLMKQWKEKREKAGKGTDFAVGEKVNLNDFLRTGIDAFNNTKTK